jgi:hypothetical protein
VRKSLTGAALGAGVGAGVGVIVQFASANRKRKQLVDGDGHNNPTDDGNTLEKERYPDLYAESEVYWLVEVMKEFRSQLPDSFDEMMLALDRFCALRALVYMAPKQDFNASWAVTAHHHAELVRDAIRELDAVISRPALKVEFEERRNEIEGWMSNELHNISMHVQTRVQDDV